MLPIVTPAQMRAIDDAASDRVGVLVERAGAAVSRAAIRMLGGTYGRTVAVVCGPGNNGADGRVAARLLADRGVRVRAFDAASCPRVLPAADLVIDAAYGTGFHGSWSPPDVGDAPVLAVDIPSGVDGLTAQHEGPVLAADRTVTFAALKPGLLFPPGAELAGQLELSDIGLDIPFAHAHLVQRDDVAGWWRDRPADDHKWRSSLRVVAGSRGMTGAPSLVVAGAQRAGAGMVHLSIPGYDAPLDTEVVQRSIPATGWAGEVLQSLDRFQAMVVGPGLGRAEQTVASVRHAVLESPVPVVVDGDGLFALAWHADGAAPLLRKRHAPTVLTPHDGEFALLAGSPPGADRIAAARRLAADTGSVVLLKGPATVVAEPEGRVLVSTTGDARLATAGTGDVLAGVVGALLATGTPAFEAAAAAAWIHGQAARGAPSIGMVAGDLPPHIPAVLEALR
jgi:NAD(P)H-hydrate epimerase